LIDDPDHSDEEERFILLGLSSSRLENQVLNRKWEANLWTVARAALAHILGASDSILDTEV
jgi:hypothetical protein